ncbi:MAG TPA: PAS domain S-box protein, partial [Ktedonobacteraceae bacterium]
MSLFSSYPERQGPRMQRLLLPTNRFVAVMQKTADLYWLLSPIGEMLEMDPSWLSFTGQQEHEASGKGWLDAIYVADRPDLEALFSQPLSADRWLESDCYIRRKDGVYRLMRLQLFPVSTSAAMVYEVVASGVDITVEHLSDAQIKLAMQMSGVGLWQYDLALQQFAANDQWRQLCGLVPDASLSLHTFMALVHPEDRARIEEIIAHLRTEPAISVQFRVIQPDNGRLRWLMSQVQYMADRSNQAGYLIGSTVDITEPKEEQERTTEILESITDGFLHLDEQWHITQANDRIEHLTGLKRRDALGKSLWEIRPEFRGTSFEEHLHTARASRQPLTFEWFSPPLDIWEEIHLYPAKQGGLWAYVSDITERKSAQVALLEREKQFRQLIDSNIIGIAVHDLEAHIYEVNDAFLTLIGYSRTEFFEQHLAWRDLGPREYRASDERALRELVRTGTVPPYETALRRKDGSLVPVLIGEALYRRDAASPLG